MDGQGTLASHVSFFCPLVSPHGICDEPSQNLADPSAKLGVGRSLELTEMSVDFQADVLGNIRRICFDVQSRAELISGESRHVTAVRDQQGPDGLAIAIVSETQQLLGFKDRRSIRGWMTLHGR